MTDDEDYRLIRDPDGRVTTRVRATMEEADDYDLVMVFLRARWPDWIHDTLRAERDRLIEKHGLRRRPHTREDEGASDR